MGKGRGKGGCPGPHGAQGTTMVANQVQSILLRSSVSTESKSTQRKTNADEKQ